MVQTRSSTKKLMKVKRPYTEKFKRSLAYIGPKKWNALPERFHHSQSKPLFKMMTREWVKSKAAANAPSFVGVNV